MPQEEVTGRLRAAASATAAACPCEVSIDVKDIPSGQRIVLQGVVDPATGTALMFEEGRTSEARYVDGKAFVHGRITGGAWIFTRTSRLPDGHEVRLPTLSAVGNPSFAFTLARGAARPSVSGDAYAVTYDLGVARPGDLLRRLLGERAATGVVLVEDGVLREVRYGLLGPMAFVEPRFAVTVRILRQHVAMPSVRVPPGALGDMA